MLLLGHGGRRLSAISFLFVLAACAAFVAHERLHDLELAQAGHASNHHDGVVHNHPGIAAAGQTFQNPLVGVGVVAVPVLHQRTAQANFAPRLLRPGPIVIDDDVGLRDVLSVYRI